MGDRPPKGPAVPNQPGTYYWDDRAEFLALSCVRDYLDANPSADRRQVYLVGDGGAAALAVSIAGHNPDVFTGVAAAGSNLNAGTQEVDLSGLRAYLIVDQSEGDDVEAGMEARDAFTQAGSPVVLERYPRDPAVASDRALLLRALTWLQGKPTPLPGAGDDRWF